MAKKKSLGRPKSKRSKMREKPNKPTEKLDNETPDYKVLWMELKIQNEMKNQKLRACSWGSQFFFK